MATASDSLSPEYVTLKGMFGDLVDKLAASAIVIPQLNGHLFASNLIPEAVFNAVQHPGPRATSYHICNDMLTPVLAIVKSNPACFYSLIESLKKVQLYDIAFKLVENLQSKIYIIFVALIIPFIGEQKSSINEKDSIDATYGNFKIILNCLFIWVLHRIKHIR